MYLFTSATLDGITLVLIGIITAINLTIYLHSRRNLEAARRVRAANARALARRRRRNLWGSLRIADCVKGN